MLLYYFPGACSLVPHIALEWIGKPYHAVSAQGKNRTPEYLKMNPQGSVPLLVDGDFSISQNVAILKYLADLNPEVPLFTSGTIEQRATVFRWLVFCNADLHGSFGPLIYPAGYANSPQAQDDIKEKTRQRLLKLFNILNERLEQQPFLGYTYSIADVYLYVMMRWAVGKNLEVHDMEHLQRHFSNVENNKYVQSALQAEDLKPMAK